MWGFHSGQICTAPTRAIVHRSKYDELVERLAGVAGALKVGDPLDGGHDRRPVISAAQRDRIESYVAAGVDEGADVVVDGRKSRATSTAATTWRPRCSPGASPT